MNIKSQPLWTIIIMSILITMISLLSFQGTVQAKPDKSAPSGHSQGNQSKPDHPGKGNKSDWNNSELKHLDKGIDLLIGAGITTLAARNLALEHHLTGYQALPPGIQKNLLRGKPLPPGIAKKMVPDAMLKDLPHHPGYEWRVAGSDLILVALTTEVVADVLHEVFK